MNSRKRILFLARWYPNRYDPMPGLFIRRHALSVPDRYEVSVLSVHLNYERDARKYETTISKESGILEICIYTRTGRTGLGMLDSLINLYRFFNAHRRGYKRICQHSGKPDLLHVNILTRCGFIALVHKFLKGTPYVITEHWTRYLPGMTNFKGFFRKWLTRKVVGNALAVMPVTRNLQQAMENYGLRNDNYFVIPNVVDTALFVPAAQKHDPHSRMFLHVSCFDDNQKNISGILRVLRRLSIRRQDWRCVMVGDGVHFAKLVQLADELKLKGKHVYFTGLKENHELAELMRQACFQVLFSRYENLPVVIPESFASGVPFLSTNVGGIGEHIHPATGRLIRSEDEDALLESLDYMLDHTDQFDATYIRQYAMDHFSKEVIGEQIAGVYQRMLAEGGDESKMRGRGD